MKHLKHCETSRNSCHSMRRYRRSMRRRRHSMWRRLRLGQRRRRSRGGHSMRRYRRWMRRRRRSMRRRCSIVARCGVTSDIGDCGVGTTPQMCNRVTNHGDMSTFSKPVRVMSQLTAAVTSLSQRRSHPAMAELLFTVKF